MQNLSLSTSHDFLLGGGEMGQLIRSIDWSMTPVGAVEKWPQSLRTAVSIMLNTHFPMYIAWGKEFTQFYNDGYRPILGSTKHPAAMGRSTRYTFHEIWDIIGPMFEGVLEGQAVGFTDFMLPLDRHGFTEECYFIFSYSPIKQEDGSTGGVLVTVTETSDRVLGERRLKTLRDLADRTYQCKSVADTSNAILGVIADNKHDIPFSLLYSFNATENRYTFEGETGVRSGASAIPVEKVLSVAARTSLTAIPVSDIFQSLSFDDGLPWPEVPEHCCICFLSRPDQSRGFGFMVLGISPRLRYDIQYQNFFKLLNDQVVTALTNVHAFEEERKRVEALAEIDRAKTAFFSNISHEFRTPLTLMLGPLEEMLVNSDNSDSNQAGNIQTAHRNSLRLLRLVNTLLDFSKIESGRIDAAFQRADLGLITRDIASNFRSLIEKGGLDFRLNFGKISDAVYVDYTMWEKIVFNLLSNAFKYTLHGSISVAMEQRGHVIVFTVSDTGIGIPEKEIPKMFERFHRVANTAGRSYEGTGIGLSLVAELVKIHQGTITVESELGSGTTFTVTIPTGSNHLPPDRIIHESNDAYTSSTVESFLREMEMSGGIESGNDSEPAESTDKAEAPLVLVVDDNSDMIRYLVRLLEKRYRTSTASDGKQALTSISAQLPDLIISDIMMPVMNGVELLKEIKSNPGTANIPVMLLSARAGEESRIEGYDVGADDYLIKPFSAKELLARVKAQIHISRTRSYVDRLLKRVFEQTPAAITILRKENFVVEFANDLYLQLVDKKRDFIGKPLLASLPELENQVVPKLLNDVISTGVPYEGKEVEVYLHRHGRRDKTWFNFTYHPLREQDGTISGVIVVCFEVTDLVIAKNRAEKGEAELEEKVRQRTSELEVKNALLSKANSELEQFAYVASHDLQEPLRKIRTFSSILQRNLPDDAKSNQLFQKIHSSADRMAKLIRDVLNYSRLSNQVTSFVPVNLNDVLSSVLIDFELLVEESKAKITSGPLPTVAGVELQLHQLFANLISNALKFADNIPVLNISSRTISRDEAMQLQLENEHMSYVEITFKDEGVGFDPRYADQVFVIFQRLNETQTSGTGIGLALCKKIVHNHHGMIRVETSPGNGSAFLIYLPINS